MKYATGLQHFAKAHKSRFFDVGIAEEHAVTFAGGLASQGLIPVLGIYSTFLQRSYDQIIHDLAIEEEHVVFAIDRAERRIRGFLMYQCFQVYPKRLFIPHQMRKNLRLQ